MEEVIQREKDLVYRLAFSQCHQKDQADDIFQNVMYRYLKRKPSFKSLEHEKAWFLRVAINISKKAEDMHSKGLKFSYVASKELQVYGDALKEIMNMTVDVFTADNLDEAVRVEPLEEVIDRLNSKIKKNHVKRLQNGECTIDIGLILEDTITNYERVADHCSNVAVCMLQVREDEYGTHEYLDNVKHDDTQFKKLYQEYKEKYYLN